MVRENLVTAYGVSTRHYSDNLLWAKIFSEVFTHCWQMTPQWKFCQFATVSTNDTWQCCPNVSTTPNTAMGCQQCLPLSVVQLRGKHCRNPHCCNGVADTFGHSLVA